jgi:hypothetical protein
MAPNGRGKVLKWPVALNDLTPSERARFVDAFNGRDARDRMHAATLAQANALIAQLAEALREVAPPPRARAAGGAVSAVVEMRERPILFSSEMVRAILDGRKTQTRRVAKVTDENCPPGMITPLAGFVPRSPESHVSYCPHGAVGDRLWVREATCISPPDFADTSLNNVLDSHGRWRVVQYVATHPDTSYARDYGIKVTPSIHMPRWASRITLELTGVRVERVQDISESDAEAEGVGDAPIHGRRDLFATLWNRLNASRGYSWESNPWVWVLTFRRVTP